MKEESKLKKLKRVRGETTPEQMVIMMAHYKKHGINIGKHMGGKAMRQTGLRWKQIYMWIFKMHRY